MWRDAISQVARLVCILLPIREAKLLCCRRPAGGNQLSTGQLNLVFRVSPLKRKKQGWLMPSLLFWSKWRDSNSRHPAPKARLELFSNNFRSVFASFIPEKLLFETLFSTVSVYSKTEYGQQCGQIQTLPSSKVNRGAFCLLRCSDCNLENENRQVISRSELSGYKQRKRNTKLSARKHKIVKSCTAVVLLVRRFL